LSEASLQDEQIIALICREMGWTWQDYQQTPAWFADIIAEMLRAEADATRKKAKSKNC